jgi:hypothetical protein
MHVHVRRKKLMTKVFINFSSSILIHCYLHTTCVKVYTKGQEIGMKLFLWHQSKYVLTARTCQDMKYYWEWTLLKAIKKLHTFKILEMYHFQPAVTAASKLELELVSLKWFHKLITHMPLKNWTSTLFLLKSQCTVLYMENQIPCSFVW